MSEPDDLPFVLNEQDILRVLRISRSSLERMLTAGTFPIPRLAGLNTGQKNARRLWSREAVLRYLDSSGAGVRRLKVAR